MASKRAAKKAKARGFTEEERIERGRERLNWRPRAEVFPVLDAIAAQLGCSRGDALERCVFLVAAHNLAARAETK